MEFNIFIKHWNRLYKQLLKQNETDQQLINNLIKTNKTITNIKNIYNLINSFNLTINQAIIKLRLIKFKSTIYSYISKIKKLVSKLQIKSIIINNTGPKEIKYKYDLNVRKQIADEYYINHQNKVNVWLKFRHFYSQLSLRIVCKIINKDIRNQNKKHKAQLKHPLRTYDLEFGNLQLDLKIIGAKQSPTKKRITIFDAKDEQSKLYYMQVIKDASLPSLLDATKQMLNYFQNLGLTIKRIRTDNAMVFKQNNFVKSFPYCNLLKTNNIIDEKIPLCQPQCNGCIERQHQVIDKEFLPLITKDDNLETLNIKAQNFMEYFNFKRYHFYTFLMYDKKYHNLVKKYQIPFNFYTSNI